MSRLCRNREPSGRPRQRIGRTVTYGVSVEDTGASQLAPWQRTAAGAGLLAPDGTVAPTVFAEMSALALATGAINLGQGFPDEDGPPEVLDAAREAIAAGVNQYPPGAGMPVLREAIARHQHRWYGLEVDDTTEVLVTAGATEALAATILAFVDVGDEVVTFEPSYDAYAALVARAGGVHRTVPLRFPDWRPDHDELRAAVTDRTRVILVNSPHNPTGAVLDHATLELVI
jgi:N-succinyldiaminopimelate aminotransferase